MEYLVFLIYIYVLNVTMEMSAPYGLSRALVYLALVASSHNQLLKPTQSVT